MESHGSLAPLIDQPKGYCNNMLDNWCLESMEIIATVRLRLDKSGTICMVVKPVLLDRCVDNILASLHPRIKNWLVVIPLCRRVLMLLFVA